MTYSNKELAGMDVIALEKLLSKKEQAFCENFICLKNGTQAALQAGYGGNNHEAASAAVAASRMLRKDKILAYVRARQREIYNQFNITPESVAGDLINVYTRAMRAQAVTEYNEETGETEKTGEYTYDSRAALKALELIGDSIGMFEKGVKLGGAVDGKIAIEFGEQLGEIAK